MKNIYVFTLFCFNFLSNNHILFFAINSIEETTHSINTVTSLSASSSVISSSETLRFRSVTDCIASFLSSFRRSISPGTSCCKVNDCDGWEGWGVKYKKIFKLVELSQFKTIPCFLKVSQAMLIFKYIIHAYLVAGQCPFKLHAFFFYLAFSFATLMSHIPIKLYFLQII